MTGKEYLALDKFRKNFRQKIIEWNSAVSNLKELQIQAAKEAKTPDYSFETPIVYNKALDEITKEDDIKIIFILFTKKGLVKLNTVYLKKQQ